jgi:D-alanyl-D-alanine carboxypeptidase
MANRLASSLGTHCIAVSVSLLLVISGCASQTPSVPDKSARPAKLIDQAKTKMERELIERIDEIRRQSQIPGIQILVDQQGEQHLNLALGLRDANLPTSFVTKDDVWHLASNTKPMTAMLIGQAVERSNLTWHTPIAEALKSHSFPLHQSVKFITVDQLLSHQAGLTEPTAILGGKLWAAVFRDDQPVAKMRSALAKGILSTPTKFAPGTRTEYSNSGYIILGYVAEQMLKSEWETLIRNRVFIPLDMKSCGFGPAGTRGLPTPDQPWGHRLEDSGGNSVSVPPSLMADNPPAFGPAGTVHCSANDWVKFLRLFVDGQEERRSRALIIRKETFNHLATSAQNGFTFSSVLKTDRRSWAQGPVYNLAGTNTMNFSQAVIAPKRGLVITVNANAGHSSAEAGIAKILNLIIENLPEN